ncbi:hypothetical protein ES708_19828 [subsurface metagenome]
MKKPITHLIIDTSSGNEYDNGDCDYCLVQMSADYVAHLLKYMDKVKQLHQADENVYALECWDARPVYFRFNDMFEQIADIYGNLASDVPSGEPILLSTEPQFNEEDFSRVECQIVHIIKGEVWWTAYIRHTNTRIESAPILKQSLLEIQRSFVASRPLK